MAAITTRVEGANGRSKALLETRRWSQVRSNDVFTLSWPRVSALSRGLIVALVGPDGVGKSSQAAQLTTILRQKRNCTALYLGSGDGGWQFRRKAKQLYRKWRGNHAGADYSHAQRTTGKQFGSTYSVVTGLSGLLSAIERYLTIVKALRLSEAGWLVICDRWPQNLQHGFFDGPFRLAPHSSWAARTLSVLEHRIYRKMEKLRPDLMIHLISDFETSHSRKPGDRTRATFNQRLELMKEMRRRDPAIVTIDASQRFEQVTGELLDQVSQAISKAQPVGVDQERSTAR